MMQRRFFVFCLILGLAGVAIAQRRQVTNADLESYRQARLRAEKDYRDNYERLGFPSPEELERRREQTRAETAALSAELRAERLERERIEAERDMYERSLDRGYQYDTGNEYVPQEYWGGGGFYPYF